MENHRTYANWRQAAGIYLKAPVLTMLFLGFSAGLPFLLVFSTLAAWLRTEQISLAAIGFFSWVGITYSVKFLWAPVVDRLQLPGLTTRLGQRRGWILTGQVLIAASLAGLAWADPNTQLPFVIIAALLVAFGSATQDIAIDAFRIESTPEELQAASAATYMIGYRLGLVAAGAGALFLAHLVSWSGAYLLMAALMGIGIVTVLVRPEPERRVPRLTLEREERVQRFLTNSGARMAPWRRDVTAWLIGAVVCPLVDFFSRYGKVAIALLLLVGLYRISDLGMAAMANPLYIDLGFSLAEIAVITNIYGVVMTITGGVLGGLFVARYGIGPMLVWGATLTAVTNLLFVWLALTGPELAMLMVTISGDNLANGFASTVFIAFMSQLTSRAYTATQYALFSSLMTLPGKFLSGFSGLVVNAAGYPWFFVIASLMGIPAILLALWIVRTRYLVIDEAAADTA